MKGMDQDSANNKRDPNSYFSANNFRVVTDEGASSGSLENEKGTKLAFKVPIISEMVLKDGTIIPPQTNLKIIGSCTMVDEIIIFTTNNTTATPNGYGQIWKCKYDEGTGKIIGLDAQNQLVPSIHLYYNQKLNFSTEYRIGRAIALYETTEKQRVYWTDNYNPVRTFNLAASDPLNTPLSNTALFSTSYLNQPIAKEFGSGNILAGTQIQFSYRLLNANGEQTTFAPPTPLLPLSEVPTLANNFTQFAGDGGSKSRSVTYDLIDLDTDYEVIQHIAIHYLNNGDVNVYQFGEDTIPSTGNMEVVCSDLDNAIIITPEEYTVINSGFDTCKDLEVQGNRLIAANISSKQFEVDFDARAYRFNSPTTKYQPVSPTYPLTGIPTGPVALLQDSNNNADDVVLLGGNNTPIWSDVPEEHDAINIFNNESHIDWFDEAQQYKYQSDGITVGGEGPNIKYEFTTAGEGGSNQIVGTTTLDGVVTDAPSHITVPGLPINTPPTYKGVLDSAGNPQPIHKYNQISGMAAPWAHSEFAGHARGEVYRYGITFYDRKGQPSFVKWIGDIKFPDVRDGYNLQDYVTYPGGNATFLKQLGIKFSVDVSSLSEDITGYSIVRLEREDKDKTKLGTGFFMPFDGYDADTGASRWSLIHKFFTTGLGNGTVNNADDPFRLGFLNDIFASQEKVLHLAERPGNSYATDQNYTVARLGVMVSPFGSIYKTNTTNTDYIETLEYYTSLLHNYYWDEANTPSATDTSMAFYYKLKEGKLPVHNLNVPERKELVATRNMYSGELLAPSDSEIVNTIESVGSIVTDYENNLYLGNISYARDNDVLTAQAKTEYPLGIGNPKLLLNLLTDGPTGNVTPTLNHMSTDTIKWQNNVTNIASGSWYGDSQIDFNGTQIAVDDDITFKSIGYRRYLVNQYGGNTFESRSTNEYTYIGHFQSIKSSNALNLTFDVFGGDTYVNYYDSEYIEQYWDSEGQNLEGAYKDTNVNKFGLAICGPVESSINTNWRNSRIWAKDRDADNIGAYAQNSNSIRSIWQESDKIQKQFFAQDFLAQFTESFPNMLWASRVKINGELSDSWRDFPIANKTEVDGIYGPINRILSFKDNLFYYQDRAMGVASLNEKSVIQDTSGQDLVLGTGGVFPHYKYVSTNTGTVHQFSVVASESAIYHYDARLKKMMKYSGGVKPISDIKGMSSFFANNVKGSITDTDKTTRNLGAVGVHGSYDSRYNRILHTFQVSNPIIPIEELENENGTYSFEAGTYVQFGENIYFIISDFSTTEEEGSKGLDLSNNINVELKDPSTKFTIGFNEFIDAFESFYDYHPNIYLEYGRRLLSVSSNNKDMYEHNVGPSGIYYDSLNSVSRINTIFAANGGVNKVFNNFEYNAEVKDSLGNDIYDETFNRAKFYNDYQTTGTYNLVLDNTIKRRMRTWRGIIPREDVSPLSRMRNPWLHCVLEYDNLLGNRHVLHEINYSYTPSMM